MNKISAFFLKWVVSAVALAISAWALTSISIDSGSALFFAALVVGLLNAFLKPILILLTLPLNILTMGLFTFVINAIMILFTSEIVDGFSVNSFWAALLTAVIMSCVSFTMNMFTGNNTIHVSRTTHRTDNIIDVDAVTKDEENSTDKDKPAGD